jgi:hypothetical protein
VWSVSSDQVNVYLGSNLVMVKRTGEPLWTLEPPTTLPLVDVLRRVSQAHRRTTGKPWRLHVHLSAAICRALTFAVPIGVWRYDETLAIAQANAAKVWEIPDMQSTGVVCSIDSAHQGLSAAMIAGTYQVIRSWAEEHNGRLVSLQPLWAAASKAVACQETRIARVAVLEPDGLTVLAPSETTDSRAICLPGKHEAAYAMSTLDGFKSPDGPDRPGDSLAMVFQPTPVSPVWRNGPVAWASHWRELT